jgi:hypothetical protein
LLYGGGVSSCYYNDQVFKDVVNALEVLEEGGTIVLHDMNPRRKDIQFREPPADTSRTWNGDCWRAAVALRVFNEIEIVVADFDHGVGVLRRRPNNAPLSEEWANRLLNAGGFSDGTMAFIDAISYEEFDEHKEELMRLVTFYELRRWLEES